MDIASSIKKYKNLVTRKYISLSNEEIDLVTKGEYWFSRKCDGQLWFYCKSNKNSKIINSNENDISTLISDIKKELDKKLSKTKDQLQVVCHYIVCIRLNTVINFGF